jgi:beta-glucosidase
MTSWTFPASFLWGVATSAQQIEGGARAGGRGESVWDRFAAGAGNIADGSRPDVTCDHYHRWREDVDRMRWLGVGAYRFSTSWARVMPDGRTPSAAGLDFYDALVDGLLEAGIVPYLTLDHWDPPQVLHDGGGWASRDLVPRFVDLALAVAGRLGDRVRSWVTHNEPWSVATLGHAQGWHAPGLRDPALALRVAHHLLLSHGAAVATLRDAVPGAELGIVLNLTPVEPATAGLADAEAARRFDGTFNRWYLDPLFRGAYPEDIVADHVRRGLLSGTEPAFVREGDLATIAAPLDFLGVNYYSRNVVRAGPDGEPQAVPQAPADQLTEMGWEVYPDGLADLLVRVTREYGPRVIDLTENGAAFAAPAPRDGRIADPRRVAYLRDHLRACHRAIVAGVPLRSYFAWSLLDNWEWGEGFARRFGLFGVDYATLERTPKDSAFWYRDTIAANAVQGPA